ncbi:hypothetical protein EEL32_10265 [Brevibacillus laterosporus]|nr:hypothetical protein [Brevibacillus laterosporus]TPG88138.1 hypothetical protein EEL32_10265 [Brevibacillus laterosporus]
MVTEIFVTTVLGLLLTSISMLAGYLLVSLISWVFGSLLIGIPVTIILVVVSYFVGRFILKSDEQR